jgi:hypothetical protein
VWLSVDPLAHEYRSLSSYNFVANNPIILLDPDGRKILWAGKGINWIGDAFQRILNGVFNGAVEGVWESDPDARHNFTLTVNLREGADLTDKQQKVYDYMKHLTTMDEEMKIDMIGPGGMEGLPDSWSEAALVEENFTALCFDEDAYLSQLFVFHHFLSEQEALQIEGPSSNYGRAHIKALQEGLKIFGHTYSVVYNEETNKIEYMQFFDQDGKKGYSSSSLFLMVIYLYVTILWNENDL